MIETDKRKAIFLLHQQGMTAAEIARRLHLSPSTVAVIIEQKGEMPKTTRSDKQQIDPELLRRLYEQCGGWMERVREKLLEEEGIPVKYSTLTRMLRDLGISKPAKKRCERVPDEPGAEMQHDTTVYKLKLGDSLLRVIGSLLYLRYSKRRDLKFYRAFNRFKMKCFFHQALIFWGYGARQCIIDNTNLARLCGTGSNAVIVPEMAAFAQQYGFEFRCHAKGHSNRKAGEERSFWTVETNFLPGRSFASLEDLNRQALEWSTVRLENRPQGKAGLIPAKAFEFECGYLTQLSPHLPAPYQIHERGTDQYGYISLAGNYYWVPGTRRDAVKVLEYSDGLKIFHQRECLAEYPLPAQGVTNQQFSPPGLPAPRAQPSNRKKPAHEEETRLRALGPPVLAYLDFALQTPGLQRHQFLRKLWALSRKMSPELFSTCLQRASQYQITSLDTIERIARLHLQVDSSTVAWVQLDENFRQRQTYQEGSLTEAPDLSLYENPPDHE